MAKRHQAPVKKGSENYLIIGQRRTFSESFKRARVAELVKKQYTVREISELHMVSTASVYRWLYKYSPAHKRGVNLVVEMESEGFKTQQLQARVTELESALGRSYLELEFYKKLVAISSDSLGVDIKKNFGMECLTTTKSSPTDPTV